MRTVKYGPGKDPNFPYKQEINIRLKPETIEWFKNEARNREDGRKYQQLIRDVLEIHSGTLGLYKQSNKFKKSFL